MRVNVGGRYFATTRETLTRYSSSSLLQRARAHEADGTPFLDRDPEVFAELLSFCRISEGDPARVYVPPQSPSMRARVCAEARFFGVHPLARLLSGETTPSAGMPHFQVCYLERLLEVAPNNRIVGAQFIINGHVVSKGESSWLGSFKFDEASQRFREAVSRALGNFVAQGYRVMASSDSSATASLRSTDGGGGGGGNVLHVFTTVVFLELSAPPPAAAAAS